MACATTAKSTGIRRGIAQWGKHPGDRRAVAKEVPMAVAEAGNQSCSQAAKEAEEKVTQVVVVVDVL